nr:MAG TPA: hypothetical protein [Crassvirales sp.]
MIICCYIIRILLKNRLSRQFYRDFFSLSI